jgi:mannitol operon repressor
MTPQQKPFEEAYPHLRDFREFLDVLNKESERGAALISAAMIDDLLGRCIRSFLLDHKDVEPLLEGFNAPLGSLSARTVGAFALGLLSTDEYNDCQYIRKVRNAFAHDVHASFQDQKISNFCSNLRLCAQDYGTVHVDARGRYTTSAVSVILNLTNRPHYAAARRLQYVQWPY